MSYVGGVLNRLRHGQGTYTFPGGYYKYTGDWALGKMHGHGIFFLGDGSTYEGTFVHGEMQGMGLRRWPDGTTYSGEFCRGEMHGEGTFIASSGKRYEGSWRDNQHHGYGELTEPDQSLYEGHFDQHKPHGIGRKTWPDKSTYEGEWRHGKCHGHGRWVDLDGKTSYEGDWVDGSRHGVGKGVWPTGLVYDGSWACNSREKVPTCLVVTRIGPDGLPDATPLVFRDAVVPEETNGVGDTMPGSSPVVVVIAPPIKLLPQFQVACCVDKATTSSNNPSPEGSTSSDVVVGPTVVVEESRHGIRMSLFQGKSPVDAAREAAAAAAAFDADSKDKRKKSTVVEAVHGESATSAAPVPLLMAFEDPTTQANVVEMIVWTLNGVATVPSIQLPMEAATTCGEYFLQFDSIIDTQGMPSAYFGFTIVRGDADLSFGAAGDKGKKDALKKK
ncbi:hypothetical protein H257_08500 [Aphanomyces astaci]|uniref:MORN repeat-containing protein 5 n=1 Tax=Aphanomyces astaci TaxID=112090 RepID=W4GEA3_APHAT|nr:hypothetical protein H257_08500 [Aphanomyces astaci]ETV77576.1 hypothetical protein H257_08500 [Aphanomyces astaci]|eukprot:XP_009832686.1 hypothetical protein H257_08500 [Aphanomyces astaci]